MNKKVFLCGLFASCVLLGGCFKKDAKTVDIFYTSDIQGFFWIRPEPRFGNRDVGGYAVLKNFLEKQKQPYLLLDGGNWFSQTPEGLLSKGEFLPRLAGSIPYTAAAVADKDLVFGWPSLRQIIQKMPYPYIISNLTIDGKNPWPTHDYLIREVNGVKVGLFALLDPKPVNTTHRLTGMKATDPVAAAKEMSERLKEKGVHVVVLLSSVGSPEKEGVSDATLAEEAPAIDLILSSNMDRENAETDKINRTFIVYPGAKFDSLGRIRLTFDKNNQLSNIDFEDILLAKDTFGEDTQIASATDTLRKETQHKMNARVTSAQEEIKGNLHGESSLGNILTDCLHKWSRLDGAVLNADSIRASLPAGRISEYDVYRMYPYSDAVTFVTIKGRDLKKALEASLAAKDNFPQISGMKVWYNASDKEAPAITRIVFNGGRVLRPQETYRIAVTDHIMAGGFGHDEFINALEFKNTFVEARQIMRSCLIKYRELDVPPLGRWQKED
ncbi:bifunctional metallophosphatase/5'-nucleotidase [Candidatus Avelusimicrobium aviculae]|uniref:bifunctional metallophosphatase/5'-nucleotidase n=1 Tax=Candidatus Avelusimicrobium aviculae TaxID=3416206 RepID=UPI003D14887F